MTPREGLQIALDYAGNTHSVADVAAMIEEGTAQLWAQGNALIVTEVKIYPQARHLHFWLAAGEKDEVIGLSRKALAWGREAGCTRATLCGRRGWERVLKDEGWQPSALVLMEREIGGETNEQGR